MSSFNDLDELLQLTKMVEATSTNSDTVKEEPDLPATVRAYDSGDYTGKATFLRTHAEPEPTAADVPKPPKDGKAYGSSGNATFRDKKGKPIENGPLFEEDSPEDTVGEPITDGAEQSAPAEGADPDADFEGAGTSIGKSLKRGLSFSLESVRTGMGSEFVNKYLMEQASDLQGCRNNPFQLGDAVQVNGIPRIFIVKNNDGNMIRTAKPTNCIADYAKGKDGVWPEYCFQCDELSKIDNANLSQADDIAEFNDRDIDTTGFNGLTIDPKPMELAQEFARERSMDTVADNLNDILGVYRSAASGNDKEFSYTAVTPKTTFVLPNGEITTQEIAHGYRSLY
jgi:hypothetical protein